MSTIDVATMLEKLGLEDNVENRLLVDAALGWLKDNTILNIEDAEAFPAVASLFVLKFTELVSQTSGVKSESLGGMSQSFSGDMDVDLWALAYAMLPQYLKSGISFTESTERWSYGSNS